MLLLPQIPASFGLLRSRRGVFPLLTLILALAAASSASAAQVYNRTKLYDGGDGSYHSYRIPVIVRAPNGDIVTFAEGRKTSNDDWGDIDIVIKRYIVATNTWTARTVLIGTAANSGTWTNPTAVVDYTAGYQKIFLFFNMHDQSYTLTSPATKPAGYRKTYMMYSTDNGASWSAKTDLTATLGGSTLSWDAVGPGNGIQRTVTHAGHLVVPATGRNFYSKDHGATWSAHRVPTTGSITTGESTIVECIDGTLLRNDRPTQGNWENGKCRWISNGSITVDANGVITSSFPAPAPQSSLPDPKCEGSILRYNMGTMDRIYFLNSYATDTRGHMLFRVSYDDGATWTRSRWLYVNNPYGSPNYTTATAAAAAGKGGYTSLAKATVNSQTGCAALTEINENVNDDASNRSLDYHFFNLEWILNGVPE
ncbi:MAG: exo-alpha-sialidase [Opitutae bacterium]|nr:exo-alpha-sialidase [Opitutae bacterium]